MQEAKQGGITGTDILLLVLVLLAYLLLGLLLWMNLDSDHIKLTKSRWNCTDGFFYHHEAWRSVKTGDHDAWDEWVCTEWRAK